jgi:hypothetical protein
MLRPTTPTRQLVRAANGDLWAALRGVVHHRSVRVAMRWVRGHAGHTFNDRADALARAGHDVPPSAFGHALAASDAPIRLSHRGSPVPGDPRRFLACMADELHLAELRARSDLPSPTRDAWPSVHWRAVARALHADDGPRGRLASRAANAALRFRLRAMCGTLPHAVGLHALGKAESPDCSCGAADTLQHWLDCPESTAPLAAARAELADHLVATSCTSALVARLWAADLCTFRAAACLVTTDDVAWYTTHVVDQLAARMHGTSSAARIVARAFHHASLLLQRVWEGHSSRLAIAAGRTDPRFEDDNARRARLAHETATRAARRPGLPGAVGAGRDETRRTDTQGLPGRRPGRCLVCLVPLSRHREPECAAYRAAHDRVAHVLRGAPPSLAPGFAHAAPLT